MQRQELPIILRRLPNTPELRLSEIRKSVKGDLALIYLKTGIEWEWFHHTEFMTREGGKDMVVVGLFSPANMGMLEVLIPFAKGRWCFFTSQVHNELYILAVPEDRVNKMLEEGSTLWRDTASVGNRR